MNDPGSGVPGDAIIANHTAYSRIVRHWEAKWNEEDERFHDPCRRLFLSHLPGKTIIDIGCGLGRDSLYFASRGCGVTATDIVADFLPLIKRKNDSVSVAAMDMTRPSFGAACFDAAYLFASFLHVPRELSLATLAGLRSMLRPGGLLFINHLCSTKGYTSYLVNDLLIDDNPAFCYCHGQEEMAGLLSRAGFGRSLFFHHGQKRKPSPVREQYGLRPYQVLSFVPEA